MSKDTDRSVCSPYYNGSVRAICRWEDNAFGMNNEEAKKLYGSFSRLATVVGMNNNEQRYSGSIRLASCAQVHRQVGLVWPLA